MARFSRLEVLNRMVEVGLVPVFYAYERTKEAWLLDLARKLRAQGVDFEALFATEDITVPTPRRGLWKWT